MNMYFLNSVLLISLLVNLAGQSLCQLGERPTIYDLTTGSKLVENQRFHLTCLAPGQDATFEWFLNDQKVIPNENVYLKQDEESSMLNIRQMNLELAGEYECRVSNRFGRDSRKISVKLEVKPKFLIEPTNISTKLNSPFSTKCKTSGMPVPTTKWEKLSSNGEVEKSFESDELAFNFTRNDVGQYRCSSENKLARIEKVIQIGIFGGYHYSYSSFTMAI